MPPPQTLSGHTALITGASRGIGRAIACRLAAHGASIATIASARSIDGLEDTVRRIHVAGGQARAWVVELADPTARAGLVAQITATLGPVDLLINNAATLGACTPASRIDAATRRQLFEVNVDAPLDLIQQALPGMQARGWGRIVNLGSDTALQPPVPYPGSGRFVHALTAYGASKAALDRYTTGLAAELHGSGITVNSLRPYKICRSESAEAVAAQMAATHPDWIEPVEVMAEAVWQLVTGPQTGLCISSRDLLHRLQSTVRSLDGRRVLGDALSLHFDS